MRLHEHLAVRSACRASLTAAVLALALAAGVATGDPIPDEHPGSRTTIGGASNPWLDAGANALRAGDAREAIELTTRGLRAPTTERDRAAGLSNLCAAYALALEYDQAITTCTDSLAVRPTWNAFHNRAVAHLRKGDLASSQRDVEAGLQINPHASLLKRVQEVINATQLQPRVSVEDAPAIPER